MREQARVEEETVKEKLAEILAECEKDRSHLIPILQRVQDAFGYLPGEAILEVGSFLGMTDVQIYGVASFYNYFRFTPLGKYPIQMCMGTACHMVGGGLVLEALERVLDIKVGGITENGEFSLDRVACIGCCGLAPVTVIGEKIYPKMSPTKVDEALVNLKMETETASPVGDNQKAEAE
jgi:NADH-quinone oxidoreductase subunit E